jgi:hypothetical protein
MDLRNVTLEVSLKPFHDPSEAATRAVARRMFEQWKLLCVRAETVSVMLWAADGSEILDYRGNLDDPFEWACWIGGANPRSPHPGDPDGVGLHSRRYPYRENPRQFTYGDLKALNAILKEVGREVTDRPIRVGATFDPGPEFAISSFKYERHNEVCSSGTMGRSSFVCCYETLHGDDVAYAGFPEGIPEGTPLGVFLGRQSQHFLQDLGFDYIWFSNGFGFGLETWALRGAVFDGKSFSAACCEEVKGKIIGFWESFRRECPDFPIETRGTNLSTGMDLSSDAAPLRDIHRGGFGMEPPPNSPWAALNGDFGLELIGWMSHIAELPGSSYPFRYYPHDPWWNNSPWLDRYGREPHDIYLPLSVARLDEKARVTRPTSINFLTVDDSYGEMPDRVPREVLCHLLDAWETGPDAPGPLVWVYPFDEYHDWTYGTPSRIDEVFFGDWFMRGAVNNGLPLNSVISTRSFAQAVSDPARFAESILVSPVPDAGSEWESGLLGFVAQGGRALLYGPVSRAGERLLQALNVAPVEPLSGRFDLALSTETDLLHPDALTSKLVHPALFSAGGMDGVVSDPGDVATRVLATATQGAQTRCAALSRALPDWQGGGLAWVRGTVACDTEQVGGHLLVPLRTSVSYPGERLMRLALQSFGFEVLLEKQSPYRLERLMETALPDLTCPLTCIARHRNAFFFSGYTPDTTYRVHFRLPQGAPILTGYETLLAGGRATYSMPRAWRRECRVFVEQPQGEVGCRTVSPSSVYGPRNRWLVSGLRNATLRFYHEPGSEDRIAVLRNGTWPFIVGDFVRPAVKHDRLGMYLEATALTGDLMITW